jgi:hypothetical protein
MKKQMRYYSIIKAAIIFLVICSACGTRSLVSDDGYTLRYQMETGDMFTVTSLMTMNSVTTQMGTDVNADINSETTTAFTVLSGGKDKLQLKMKFDQASQKMSGPMGGGSTDFSSLIGKEVEFALMPVGNAEAFRGLEALPEITTATGETMNAAMYKMIIENTFFDMPEQPVKVGDTWSEEDSTEIPIGESKLSSQGTTIYRVVEEVEMDGLQCLKIEIDGEQTMSGEFEQNGMPLALSRSTKSTGTIYFAYEKGMYTQMDVTSEGNGIINVLSAGMELPQTIQTQTKVRVQW